MNRPYLSGEAQAALDNVIAKHALTSVSADTDRDPETGNSQEVEPFPVSVPPVSETGNAAVPLYADVAALLDGTMPEPPAPEILGRSDGRGLFYAGQVNLVFGDPESGKTWVALAAAAEALRAGQTALVLDLDHNGVQATVQRLLMLGAPVTALRDPQSFRYVEPEDHLHLADVVADVIPWRPDVTVLDSIGELLPLFGASSNSPDDFTMVHARVMKPLAAKAGSALIAIDHLAKNQESRAQGATGTSAKRRAIGGASLRVKLLDAFTPGRGGACLLTIHKDRHGGLRAVSPVGDQEPVAGTFRMTTLDGATSWRVYAPEGGERNPEETAPPEDVAAIEALSPRPETVREARERLGWNMGRTVDAMRAWRRGESTQPAPATALPVSRTQGAETGNGTCEVCGEPSLYPTHPTCEEKP